ncbi:MAG: ABC transporter permease [Acholeplasmataceae bacterium]|jgi:predicted lysophospholipase L1 biosynthesis ABC-type transport system permease subunit|nr:ABC transporter permease [Acholeplasmataceae bacterium]
MIIGIKDILKLFAITIVILCATFVCTIFLNYNIDIRTVKDQVTTEQAIIVYNAEVSSGEVTAILSGGFLALTAVVLLMFYIKNYIDNHAKELGILKALGHSNLSIAKHFSVFGVSVLAGSVIGYVSAWIYMPKFYKLRNDLGLLPDVAPRFNVGLFILIVIVPFLFFSFLAVIYAIIKLRKPVLMLVKDLKETKVKKQKEPKKERNFLKELTVGNLLNGKTLCFFIFFSAFCFSMLIQMSMSMKELGSDQFAWIMIVIGIILGFVILLMSLSIVIKGNSKTIAMMKVFGYTSKEYSKAILEGYRPIAYIGFILGSIFQYVELKLIVDIVFKDFDNIPDVKFNFKGLLITLIIFLIAYEVIIYAYKRRIEDQPIKEIMLE